MMNSQEIEWPAGEYPPHLADLSDPLPGALMPAGVFRAGIRRAPGSPAPEKRDANVALTTAVPSGPFK